MTQEEAKKILSGYVKACNEDDFLALEMFEYEEVIEAMTMGANALSEPSLPSDIDEAAWEYFVKTYGIDNIAISEDIKRAVKFGAEWLAGQGVTVKKKIGKIDDGINQIPTYCNGFEITELDVSFLNSKECGYGDEVIVQIRKK